LYLVYDFKEYDFINSFNFINKTVFITGTPGVGKTTIATELYKKLAKNYICTLIKINDLAIENDLIDGEDLKKGYKIVNIDKLDKKLNFTIDSFFNSEIDFIDLDNNNNNNNNNNLNDLKIAIVEGHLSHLCKINESIYKVIVLRLNPEVLEKRLKSRQYSEFKIKENIEAEALAVCSVESYENHGEKVNEIDTTNLDIEKVLAIIEGILFNEDEYPVGNVDFIHWILE